MTSKILTFSLVKGSGILDENILAGLEKSVLQSQCLGTEKAFILGKSVFILRDQANHLPIKSLKEKTMTCHGQAKFESFLTQGHAGIKCNICI